jgi:hypothetical protein
MSYLDKKVSDLTVAELFQILDLRTDLIGQQRDLQKKVNEGLEQVLADAKVVDDSLSMYEPKRFRSIGDLHEWAMHLGGPGQEYWLEYDLVVIYAWARRQP